MDYNKDELNDKRTDRRKHLLLIVDLDTENLVYMSMLLQRFDFLTEISKSAREAFVSVTTTIPSLIITALSLKDMNGLNLIKLIRKNSKTANIPFIALRNKDDALGEQYAFRAGAVECLTKPVAAELLYRAVQGALENRPRVAMRIRTIQPVDVSTKPFDGCQGLYTLDISERGLFIRTAVPAHQNAILSLKINLNGIVIAADASVIHTCPPHRGPHHEPGMGLKFTHLSINDLELLRTFIKNEITRGLIPEMDLPY